MAYKQSTIAEALEGKGDFADDRLFVVPSPDLEKLRNSSASSIDLRLGRWFLTLRKTRHHILDVKNSQAISHETDLATRFFVRFDNEFILHPRSFVLAATLEWIKVPRRWSAAIVGKSSWGRRGLIIETAPAVHPGFSGCLTLELTNVGEVPIALIPGMLICQILFDDAKGTGDYHSTFDGLRRPALGEIKLDPIAAKLASGRNAPKTSA